MNEESRELLQEIHEMRHRMEALEAKMDDVLLAPGEKRH